MIASLQARAPRGWRTPLKMAADAAVVAAAVALAYLARFEQLPEGTYGRQLAVMAIVWPLVRVGLGRVFGIYAQSWRMFALDEALTLAVATGVGSLVLFVLRVAIPLWTESRGVAVPLSVIALEGAITLLGIASLRVITRLRDEYAIRAMHRAKPQSRSRPALLVGAGRAGRRVARELSDRPDLGYRVVGFLDDDVARHGQVLEGVRVLGSTAEVEEVVARTGAEVLILTMPSVSRAQLRAVVERCARSRLPVRTVPGFHEVLGDHLQVTRIRPLRIEDLLGREVVEVDVRRWDDVEAALRGRRVVVTGAGGSIGAELCRQLAALAIERLILVESSENNLFDIESELRARHGDLAVACLADVRDHAAMDRVFTSHRPQVVFHAAAYKHVPMMEKHPAAAIENNVLGTNRLVEVAHAHRVERFLFISTDKAVHPVNVMGASKRFAEMIVQAKDSRSATKFCCVRFGNVLGSRGSVFHTFRRQIEEGGPVTVTHPEATRFFMTIPEAVRLVIQAATVAEGGEVFQLEMGEPVRIADLARQMIALTGATEEQIPITYVGLRPGEKLTEELWNDDEGAAPSGIGGIRLARLVPIDVERLEAWIAALASASAHADEAAIRRLLRDATGYRRGPASDHAPTLDLANDAGGHADGGHV